MSSPERLNMRKRNNTKDRAHIVNDNTWWRNQMETFSALLDICAGNSPVPGEFPSQRPMTRSFDVIFDLRLNKRLSKQSWGWWFETLSRPLWRHRYEIGVSKCGGNESPSKHRRVVVWLKLTQLPPNSPTKCNVLTFYPFDKCGHKSQAIYGSSFFPETQLICFC